MLMIQKKREKARQSGKHISHGKGKTRDRQRP